MKTRAIVIALFTAFIIASCTPLVTVIPTETVLPTETPLPTNTALPTLTAEPSLSPTTLPTHFPSPLPDLETAPTGFSWKLIPEYKLAILVPDDWFLKQTDVFDVSIAGQVDISQKNFDENGKYSIGMAVTAFVSDDPDLFTESLITDFANANTTTKIIDTWNSEINAHNVHHLKIQAFLPDETEPDKTIQYSFIISDSWVHLVVFKSPTSIWEQVAGDFSIMLDYATVFSE